jgi:hypothetical protein
VRPLLTAALLALATFGCAAQQRAEHKNLCPGETAPRCMAEEVCGYDTARGCYLCSCRDPESGPQKPGWVPDIPGPPPPSP